MKLTSHFTLEELTKTSTGINNDCPNFDICQNLYYLCEQLEIIRNITEQPIIVNSGYRSSAVNKAVGGVSTSAHLEGKAADITASDFNDLVESVELAIDSQLLRFDQIIFYPKRKFIHIGFTRFGSSELRYQVLTQ